MPLITDETTSRYCRKRKRSHFTSLLCLFGCFKQTTRAQEAVNYTCDFYNDSCRPEWQLDGWCDSDDSATAIESGCQDNDCWDCDPCRYWSYACSACLGREGCYWCPGDALCLSQPLEADFWTTLHSTRISNCPRPEDWVTTCDSDAAASSSNDPVFGDAHYAAMQWMFDLVQVESVWREGITGQGVRVRINDDGIDPFHPEFIANFDSQNSCELKYPQDNNRDVHGTAIASIVGGDANGACSVGIAPDSKISSCNVNQLADAAFVFSTQLPDQTDISINAWNAKPCQYSNRRQRKLTTTRQLQQEDDNNCPFDSNHPASPCPYCTTNNSTASTTTLLTDSLECRNAIAYYCRWYYEEIPCLDYLDYFVTCQYHALDAETQDTVIQNVVNGRKGRGVLMVHAAGDGGKLGGDANMDGFAHSRFTITVGAVDKSGLATSYSTPGSPVLVSAPGGDFPYMTNNIVARPGGGCRDAGFGTAYAVSVVGGVVALMLQVNPELGWRDIHIILAKTAQQPQVSEPTEWTTNAAGYAHSYRYGFGIVNATEAVMVAKNWSNFPREEQIVVQSGAEDPIILVDNANNVTTSIVQVPLMNPFFRIESVVVYLALRHASRGDLKITLTSPGGTESLLARSKRPENTLLEENVEDDQNDDNDEDSELWKFMTVRNLWEYPGGDWQLRIVDESPGVLEDCMDFPWEYTYTAGGRTETVTCRNFEQVSSCTNEEEVAPVLFGLQFEGRTLFDSCCKCGGGDNRRNMTNVLKAFHLVVYGHVAADAQSGDQLYIPKSTCQFSNDTCPETRQFNHICDDTLLRAECRGGDCFDCDACQAFSYDCNSCVSAGCKYCPGDGICMSIALDEPFWDLHPDKSSSCPTSSDWKDSCEKRAENKFPDPLYEAMLWSYDMIKVEEAWNRKFDGSGVHVRINDDGVAEHPEFDGKYDAASSCREHLPRDPEKDVHGTAVASIVAGNTNNECAVGIAPGAEISSCVGPDTLGDAPAMLVSKLEKVHISVNSWGPNVCQLTQYYRRRRLQKCIFSSEHSDSPCEACGDFSNMSGACEVAVSYYCARQYKQDDACAEYFDLWVSCEYHLLPLDAHESFVKAVTEGREGKGIIFIFSSGNTNEIGADTNFNGFINSRFTIAVGAVGKDKKHASYSTTGSGVFVSAPGGDYDSVSGNLVAKPGGGCHDITVGTSFAAPVVAGVVALMLQFQPDLGWRDIQGILAMEAQDVDPDHPSWVTNAAGYNHSYAYGFGLVSVHDAMNRASVWKKFGDEQQLMRQTETINLAIADSGKGITTSTLSFDESSTKNFVTESVVVYLDVQHPSRGDLFIVLTSPGGTDAILTPGDRPENTQLEGNDDDFRRWKLLSLRTWGEFPTGDWKLSIQDRNPGTYGDCVDIPWERVYAINDEVNETLSCKDFEYVTDCNDIDQVGFGVVSMLYQNRSILESCCSCGGGQNSTEVAPILSSWRLVIYGHLIQSIEDLVIYPSSSGGGGSGGGGSGGSGSGGSGGSGNDKDETDSFNTASTDDDTTDTDDGDGGGSSSRPWDDRGNSGLFSGGGGTAYWSEGWRGTKDGDAYDNMDVGSGSSTSGQCAPADTLLAISLALLGLAGQQF